LDLFLDLLWFY